jgi:hypothetical protein
LDAAPWGEENGGSLGSIRVIFFIKGGGWGPGSGLFPRVGRGSLKEVGVPVGGAGQGQKQTNGVRASSLGARLWGHGPSHRMGLINQVGVVNRG